MLLLAAGRGTRFGGPLPKAYLPLCGKPILLHSAERLRQAFPAAELIVLVGDGDQETWLAPLLPDLQRLGARIAVGGATRQQSMAAGLAMAAADCDIVLVHDAARPLFPIEGARTCVALANEHGAALLAAPVADTLKRVGPDGRVDATQDRSHVHAAQTPQALRRDVLERALQHAKEHGIEATDDVGLAEHIGVRAAIAPGSAANQKITRPADLAVAAALLQQEGERP